jgi:hypothetical protein
MLRGVKEYESYMNKSIKLIMMEYYFPFLSFLFFLLVTFYPLLNGNNFLPYNYYSDWGEIAAKSCSKEYKPDHLFLEESEHLPGSREWDAAGLSILYPMQKLASDSARKGFIPTWDPYIGCGIPTFGGGQFRPFNPFQLPFYFNPNANVYSFSILLEIIAGFGFMLAFLLKKGLSKYASTFGGLLFVLNPYVFNRLSFLDHLAAYFFLPLLLIAVEKLKEKGCRSLFLASVPFIIMGHVGHPELCFLNCLIASLYFLFIVSSPWKEKIFKLLSLGIVVAFSLSLYIFPLLKEHASSFSYKNAGISNWLFCGWNHILVPTTDIFLLPAVAFFAIVSLTRFREKEMKFFLFLLLFSFLYITGTISPKMTIIIIPPFYFKFFFWFAVSCMAAFGLESFLKEKINGFYLLFSFIWLILVFAALVALPLKLVNYFPGLYMLLFLSFIPLVALTVTRFKGFAKKTESPFFGALLVLIMILPYSFPLSKTTIPWNNYEIKSYDVLEHFKNNYGNSRISSICRRPYTAFPFNNGSSFGIHAFELNSFLFPNTYFQQFGGNPDDPTFLAYFDYQPQLLKRAGVKFLCVPKEGCDLPIQRLNDGSFASLYEIPDSKGRIFFASKVYPVSQEFLMAKWFEILPLDDSQVLVEEKEGMLGSFESPQERELRFLEDSYQKVTISAFCDRDAFFVLRDTFNSDWKAFVNGEKTEIFKVDGCFRGVVVPKGNNRIEFIYRPYIVYFSSVLTIIFSIFVLLGIFSDRMQRILAQAESALKEQMRHFWKDVT